MKHIFLLLGGALVGGLLGYAGFFWLAGHGFYALILPGGLLGLGAGVARNRSVWLAVLCGLLATALGLFVEWRFAPFVKDESLGYFLLHVHQLKLVTLLLIAVGGGIGFWMPYSRIEKGARAGMAREPGREPTTTESD